MPEKAFSFTGFPPLRAYRAPEVVRSNTVGSPLGGRVRGKIAEWVQEPLSQRPSISPQTGSPPKPSRQAGSVGEGGAAK